MIMQRVGSYDHIVVIVIIVILVIECPYNPYKSDCKNFQGV